MTGADKQLLDSYCYCRKVAKQRAGNFYYSFMVLPREKSNAMCAVYAFMRYCDDIADDPSIGRNKTLMLEKWRESLENAAAGDCDSNCILPAFHDTLVKFGIPREYFHQLIDGATMDITARKYETFEQLYDYCYKVASVVGMVCIHIFGFTSSEAKKYAEYCGIAFQLTNILRDVKEDASMGRIYIPEDDLRTFNYSAQDLMNGVLDTRYHEMMKFEVQRAKSYYNAAMPLLPLVHPSGRAGLRAMIEIYSGILDKIEQRDYDVFSSRVSLSKSRKISIAVKGMVRSKFKGGRSYQPELQL